MIKTEMDLQAQLESLAGWSAMTAYDRAFEACRELTRRGRKVPSWSELRGIIGKGSAGDIRRAVEEYRVEQGRMLADSDRDLLAVPAKVAKAFKEVWKLAAQQATDKYQADVEQWQNTLAGALSREQIGIAEVKRLEAALTSIASEIDQAHALSQKLAESNQDLLSKMDAVERSCNQKSSQIRELEMALADAAAEKKALELSVSSLTLSLSKAEKRIDTLIGGKASTAKP